MLLFIFKLACIRFVFFLCGFSIHKIYAIIMYVLCVFIPCFVYNIIHCNDNEIFQNVSKTKG